MEIFTLTFLVQVLTIVVIDLVLAGDNAIIIGLASRKLPEEQRSRAIFWGTIGAVIMRILATLAIVWILKIPGLLLIGGIVLLWIAFTLLTEDDNQEVKAGKSFWSAIRTIIIADTIMSLDNVLAVGGASHGSFLLVILGLVISVPIVVWGSNFFLKLLDKFPIILYFGSGVLAWTAGGMIAEEPIVRAFIDDYPWIYYLGNILLVVLILLAGWLGKPKKPTVTKSVGG